MHSFFTDSKTWEKHEDPVKRKNRYDFYLLTNTREVYVREGVSEIQEIISVLESIPQNTPVYLEVSRNIDEEVKIFMGRFSHYTVSLLTNGFQVKVFLRLPLKEDAHDADGRPYEPSMQAVELDNTNEVCVVVPAEKSESEGSQK